MTSKIGISIIEKEQSVFEKRNQLVRKNPITRILYNGEMLLSLAPFERYLKTTLYELTNNQVGTFLLSMSDEQNEILTNELTFICIVDTSPIKHNVYNLKHNQPSMSKIRKINPKISLHFDNMPIPLSVIGKLKDANKIYYGFEIL